MWAIPYKTVDRTGYEQTDDDDSFLGQGQHDPLFLQHYSEDEAVQQISRMMRNNTDANENEENVEEDIMDDF